MIRRWGGETVLIVSLFLCTLEKIEFKWRTARALRAGLIHDRLYAMGRSQLVFTHLCT